MTGTVFVISDLIGKKYNGHPMMTERMLASLSSKGWEIGSHTRTHPNLTELSDLEVSAELIDSKRRLEDVVSTKILGMAYPGAAYDARIKSVAARYYTYARSSSTYPPQRVNSLQPRDKMELRSMGGCEHAWALPLHLFGNHVARIIGYRSGMGRPRSLKRGRGWFNPPGGGLEARFIRKGVRNLKSHQWLILTIHDISPKPLTGYSISNGEFREIVKAVTQASEIVNLEYLART